MIIIKQWWRACDFDLKFASQQMGQNMIIGQEMKRKRALPDIFDALQTFFALHYQ